MTDKVNIEEEDVGAATVGKMAYAIEFNSSSELSCPCPACDYGKGPTGKIIGQDREMYQCPKCLGKLAYSIELGKWSLLGKCFVSKHQIVTEFNVSTEQVETEEVFTIEQKEIPGARPNGEDLRVLESLTPADYMKFSHNDVDVTEDLTSDRLFATLDQALECIESSNKSLVEEAWEGAQKGKLLEESKASSRTGAESYTRDRDADQATEEFLRDRYVAEIVDDL